jgi:acetyl esterase
MSLQPRVRAFLDMAAAASIPTFDTIQDERNAMSLLAKAFAAAVTLPSLSGIEDRLIPGPLGEIPIRIYTPHGAGPFPVLVYFHGGGFYLGNIESDDGPCREIANKAGCIVVSVDYRLAPEHKFPAAVEDCYAATRWAAENASALGGDSLRIAVQGSSAGGNMAAGVALMARDRGYPPLMHQILLCPVLNYAFDTPSYQENADGYILTRESMMRMWNLYLQTEADGTNPYASPLQASDLRGLPPAWVVTAEYDPLRDEGEAYAARLREAGVSVVSQREEGGIHALLPPEKDEAPFQYLAQLINYLRSAFSLTDKR